MKPQTRILKVQVTGLSVYMIGLAIHERDEHHDVAFLTLFDWSHRLVALAASGLKVKQKIETVQELELCFKLFTQLEKKEEKKDIAQDYKQNQYS